MPGERFADWSNSWSSGSPPNEFDDESGVWQAVSVWDQSLAAAGVSSEPQLA
jgi:hypothetical protein